MESASKLQKLSAALASVAVTFTIVWAVAGYAYPDLTAFGLGQLAKKTTLHSRS